MSHVQPRWRRVVIRSLVAGVVVLGILTGIYEARLHLSNDPFVDTTAYYDAGARLNAGQSLYIQSANTDEASFYRYPPLLAIAFRPLAALPYGQAVAIWEVMLLVAFGLTLVRLGLTPRTGFAVAVLALPIAWALSIGQAQTLVTLLLAIGSPWSVALAANLKIAPALAAVYWLGRRDWRSVGQFAGWMAALAVLQLVLEPSGSIAFLSFTSLTQVGSVINLSPYAISPPVWVALVAGGGLAALALAPTRYGWAAAVTFSVLAPPRLLSYMFSSLLAALGGPRATATRPARPDAAVDGAH